MKKISLIFIVVFLSSNAFGVEGWNGPGGWYDDGTKTQTDRAVMVGGGNLNPLIAAMEDGQYAAIQIIGDSTGVETSDWPYLLGAYLGAQYPAYTIKWHLWTDTVGGLDDADVYATPVTIQSGAGGDIRMHFSDSSTDSARIDDTEIAEVGANDLDIRIQVCPTGGDWTPSNIMTLVGHWSGSSGNYSWFFHLTSTGLLRLYYSTNGSTILYDQSTTSVPNTGTTPQWLRATLDIDNGSSGRTTTFYYSSDGVTYTQIGDPVTTAGTFAGFYNSTAPYEIGVRGTALYPFHGDIYQVEIRSGIDSPTILNPMNISAWVPYESEIYLSGGPQLDIINGSKSGGTIFYHADASRLPRVCKNYEQILTFISLSHNETSNIGYENWIFPYSDLIDDIKTQLPLSSIVLLTQNARYSPAENIDEHAIRRLQLMGWADQKGYQLIDTYGHLLSFGDITADGIHPDTTGNAEWRDAISNWLFSAIPN